VARIDPKQAKRADALAAKCPATLRSLVALKNNHHTALASSDRTQYPGR
jgi:hypothetical protein